MSAGANDFTSFIGHMVLKDIENPNIIYPILSCLLSSDCILLEMIWQRNVGLFTYIYLPAIAPRKNT